MSLELYGGPAVGETWVNKDGVRATVFLITRRLQPEGGEPAADVILNADGLLYSMDSEAFKERWKEVAR